ncbi:alpha-1,6-glucosidase domain-containing protein [Catenovulum agarivorans]|uniref:alpha-1,6-glucosidase domain-containing protein n=1 Tax=Catenovulum agarivorans TaxID=1172192 RepID=UPI00145CC375|nr:alpha-1,6-glucosidase domain-containing protein [Catenovulum agarivorans]
MIERKIQISLVAATVSAALAGCNVSNEKGLDEVDNINHVDTGLICQAPSTIKVDSFGTAILDENGAKSCEIVEKACLGGAFNPILNACEGKGRHEQAPETDLALAEDGYAVIFFTMDGLSADDLSDPGNQIIIHAWNNANCNAFDPNSIVPGDSNDLTQDTYWATDWATGILPTGYDDNYGLFWKFKLVDGHNDCANFIIHRDSTKYPDGDMKAFLGDTNPNKLSYIKLGETSLETGAAVDPYFSLPSDPVDGLRAINTELAAHWFDTDVLLLNDDKAQSIRLYYSQTQPKLFPGDGYRGVPYVEFVRSENALTDEQKSRAMYRSGMTTFETAEPIDEAVAKQMLKSRLVAVALDANGDQYTGNLVQTAGVLDALYTMGDNDADEATLGIVYDGDNVTASVWAPTASDVKLKLYNDMDSSGNYSSTGEMAMTFDDTTGIWSYTGTRADLDRKLFRYNISVYHHLNDNFENYEVIDPYAISLTTNGRYARFVDLNDADLKPENWDTHTIPTIENPEDAVVYEGHIRDFSIMDESTPAAHRGKYLAFTHNDSAPVQHLKSLADAGLTHFQVLPANDIASIDENTANRIELDDTVGDLCAINANAQICSIAQDNVVIRDLLDNYSPTSERGRQLLNDIKDLDGFNWGYDPYAFNAPEGSYATNPEDTSRIVEMRAMVQALHEMGLRTSLDVVYNHTSSSGLWDNSVLDKIVPGYYQRLNTQTGDVLGDSCCQDTATEHKMAAKLMTDTLVSWSVNFKFDAFRFDLMNLVMKEAMLDARDAVTAVDADTYFYGEGWPFGPVQAQGATQATMAGTSIGSFSDVQRDGVRNGALFTSGGNGNDVDNIRIGLAGNISDYTFKSASGVFAEANTFNKPGQSQDPADTINYVDKHDNETLWDQLQYSLGDDWSAWDRARAHVVAGSFPLLSQGIPFMQMGSDLLRSKSMDRNTYNSTDYLNKVDFTKTTNNWGVSLPVEVTNYDRTVELLQNSNIQVDNSEISFASDAYKELLKIRSGSKLFRLNTAEQIKDRVGFHNVGASQTHGVIVMSIDDGAGCLLAVQDFEGNCDQTNTDNLRADLDANYDAMVVVFNGTQSEQTMTIPTATDFELHSVQQGSADNTVASSSFSSDADNGYFTVPALTTAVFVKNQDGVQGAGLSALATVGRPDVPPYGATDLYLVGTVTSWDHPTGVEGETNVAPKIPFVGNSSYAINVTLEAGSYEFKVAPVGWGYPNIGDGGDIGQVDVTLGQSHILRTNGDNVAITIEEAGTYTFILNGSDRNAPSIIVKPAADKPKFAATAYIRGTVNANGGWNTEDPMLYVGNGKYVTSIYLESSDDNYMFKLASEDWGTINFGATGSSVTLGQALTLSSTDNDNISLPITESGDYVFEVDAANPAAPILTVSKETLPYSGTAAHLRGFNGDWGTPYSFTYYGAGYYGLDLKATSNTLFKIADASWASINFGMDYTWHTGTFGNTSALANGGADINLNVSGDTDLRMIMQVTDDASNAATLQVINIAEYDY